MPSQLYALLFKELILLRQNLIAQSFPYIFIFGEVKMSLRWWSTFANYTVDRSVTVKQGHSYYSEGKKNRTKPGFCCSEAIQNRLGLHLQDPLFSF